MKDQVKFKEYIAALCELHNKSMSALLIDLYWKVLEPFTDDQCESAFKELIYSSRFFPKPIDFIETINGKQNNKATAAWIEVIDSIKRIGNYQSVKFSDTVIHSVIQAMGGWPGLCVMETDEVKWKQREFERLYEVISAQHGTHPDYLPGTHEMENFSKGIDIQNNIIRIGFDKQNIKMVGA